MRKTAADVDQALPANLEAERCVLGAIILHNDAYLPCAQILKAADFFRDAHRGLYEVLEHLLGQSNGSVDLVTAKNELARRGDLETVGLGYLSALLDGVPRGTNVEHYARIIKEKSTLRGLIYASNKTLSDAYEAEKPSEDILRDADSALLKLRLSEAGSGLVALKSRSGAILDRLEWSVEHKGELRGVTTGFDSLNQMTLGWRPGELIIVAARPSIGKSIYAKDTAVAVARSLRRDGSPCHAALYSMEMTKEEIEQRILSGISGVPASRIDSGYLNEADYGRLSQALGDFQTLNLHINDAPSLTVADIRAETRALRSEHGLDLIVVDYVQLMDSPNAKRGANRSEELGLISRGLKKLAGELQLPVMLLSQLKRTDDNKEPQLSDLRESGALEQDASAVVFLHRKDHRSGGPTKLIINKQRNGPTGARIITLERDCTRFIDGGDEPEEPQAQPTRSRQSASPYRDRY